jgi:hypothetical protein
MGAVVWLVASILSDAFAAPGVVARAVALTALVGSGFLVYAVGIMASGTVEMRQVRAFLRRRDPAT